MTQEELLKARQELVHRMFSTEGEEFFTLVRENCRPGVLAITDELIAKLRAQKNDWQGYTWWKFNPGAKGKGATQKVLYIHGGGWVMDSGIAQYTFADYLVEKLECEVWFPEYPIIPEGNGLTALEMVTDLYLRMLKECGGDGAKIALGGDSAGAGLALSLAEHLLENEISLPNTVLLVSPGLFSNADMRNKEEQEYCDYTAQKDPVVALKAIPTVLEKWRGPLDPSDYRINPSCGRIRGLPTLLVFSGGYECMERGIRTFVERAIMEDVDVRYYVRNKKIHNFLLTDPEAETERRLIVERMLDPN